MLLAHGLQVWWTSTQTSERKNKPDLFRKPFFQQKAQSNWLDTLTLTFFQLFFFSYFGPFGWDCRISRLYLLKEVRHTSHNEGAGCDTKPSNGEALVLELWGIWSTTSVPWLPVCLRPGVAVPLRVTSLGQIELFYLLFLKLFDFVQIEL